MTREIHGNTYNKYRRNLLELYDRGNPDSVHWYREAHVFLKGLSKEYGVSLDIVCQVCSALSPAVSWEVNKRDTETILREGSKGVVSTYGANKKKSLDILAGRVKMEKKSKKTYNFYMNLLYPNANRYVTIDRHAIKAMHGQDKAGGTSITVKQYRIASAVYNEVAEELDIKASELQARVWVNYKEKVGR